MTTATAEQITERVARGVAWMDVTDPTWWREDAEPVSILHDSEPIDLDRLNLDHPTRDILGHRWGHYGYAMRDAPLPAGTTPAALGFQADRAAERAALTVEWRRVIRERRQAAADA